MATPVHHCTHQTQDIAMVLSTIMIFMPIPPAVPVEEDTMMSKLDMLMKEVIALNVLPTSEAAPICIHALMMPVPVLPPST